MSVQVTVHYRLQVVNASCIAVLYTFYTYKQTVELYLLLLDGYRNILLKHFSGKQIIYFRRVIVKLFIYNIFFWFITNKTAQQQGSLKCLSSVQSNMCRGFTSRASWAYFDYLTLEWSISVLQMTKLDQYTVRIITHMFLYQWVGLTTLPLPHQLQTPHITFHS